MLRTRIIPSLLLNNGGLCKTVNFKNPTYVGDPINAIKIFNDKEADELLILDITASRNGGYPDFDLLARLNREAFMPLGYGGGIRHTGDISRILSLGYEKVVLNSAAVQNPHLITEAARICGSQSVVVCIDVKRDFFGTYHVYDHIKRKSTPLKAVEWAAAAAEYGAGEILLYSVDRDGTFSGYDVPLVMSVTQAVRVPVIALGGASSIGDFQRVVLEGRAAAAAAGSMFVFHGPHRAVLITYPDKKKLHRLFARTLKEDGGA